ncbi:hypothetical protein CP983_40860 [Streptomyces chartreusis]|nr:hypothetical protein CP983_40860 [Streptomyces chartreusis]
MITSECSHAGRERAPKGRGEPRDQPQWRRRRRTAHPAERWSQDRSFTSTAAPSNRPASRSRSASSARDSG